MNELIFFNPGDSLSNTHDYNEAVRTCEIYKGEQSQHELVIAKDPKKQEFAIFYAHDQVPMEIANIKNDQENSGLKSYRLSKRI